MPEVMRGVLRVRRAEGEGVRDGQKNPGAVAQTGPGHQTRNGDKYALQQRLTTGCANLQTYEEKMAGAQSSSPLRQPLHGGHHSVMNVTTQVLWCNFTVKLKVLHLNSR